MADLRKWIFLAIVFQLCIGCTLKDISMISMPKIFQSEGEQALSAGIKSYKEGNYKEATRLLEEASSKGLRAKSDQVKVHKYLAFIYCVTGQKKKCESEFGSAFKVDPNFDLQPAEAGHPMWGPVFRSVKAKVGQY